MSAEGTMHAVWYERNGPAKDVLQYGVLPKPAPREGEVLVQVAASSVNPVDAKRRRGVGSVCGTPMPFPRIVPHDDGAGIIADVGPGVSAGRVGQRVWVYLAQAKRPYGPPELRAGRAFGTAAEYVVLPEQLALPLPDGVSFAEGSVVGIPAITAHRCILADGNIDGRTVLVAGGAGSVGQYAIQLAKLSGATVIATVSGQEKTDLVRALGADHVVDYKREDAAERILAATGAVGVDLICETDFAANLALNAQVLAPQGRINAFGSDSQQKPEVATPGLFHKEAVIRFIYYYVFPDAAFSRAIADIGGMLECGGLRHPVAGKFPLRPRFGSHEAGRRLRFG